MGGAESSSNKTPLLQDRLDSPRAAAAGERGSSPSFYRLPTFPRNVSICQLAGGASEEESLAHKRIQQKLMAALVLAFVFMIVEVVGGIWAHSLAIITDAAHLLSDVSGFGVAVLAAIWAKRKSQEHFSYGYHRVEVLGALASVMTVWLVTGILLFEAVQRIITPEPVNGKLMFIIAVIGVGVNVLMMVILGHHHHGHSHSHDHAHEHDDGHDHAHDHSHSHHDHSHPHHDHSHTPALNGCCGNGKGKGKDKQQLAAVAEVEEGGSSQGSDHDSDAHAHEHKHAHAHEHHHGHNGGSCHHSNSHPHSHSHEKEGGREGDLEAAEEGHHHHHHSHSHDTEGEGEEEEGTAILKAAGKGHGHAHGSSCGGGHGHGHGHGHNHSSSSGALAAPGGNGGGGRTGGGCSHGHDHANMNVRGAIIHVIGDFVQSIGVAVAGALIWWHQDDPRWYIADPICTFLFAGLVLWTTRAILRDISDVLMERVPRGLCIKTIHDDLSRVPGVEEVHDLHVWSLTPGIPLLCAHVNLSPEADATAVLHQLNEHCRSIGIDHSTIQLVINGYACPCES